MSKRNWLNLGLLMLILVMAGAAYFRPGKEPEPSKPTLLAIQPSEVSTVRLQARSGPEIRLKRTSQGWALTQPKQLPARRGRLQAVWDLASAKSQARVSPEPAKAGESGSEADQPGDYGLDDPYLTVQMGNHGIRVGDRHPFERQRYVQVGDTIHLVKARAVRSVGKEWPAYASRALVPAGRTLQRIELPAANLKRAADDAWTAVDGDLTDKEAAQTARAWKGQRATSVAKAPEEPAGEVAGQVALHFQETASPLRYRIYRSEKALRLVHRDQPVVYKLRPASADSLLKPGHSDSATPAKGDGPGAS